MIVISLLTVVWPMVLGYFSEETMVTSRRFCFGFLRLWRNQTTIVEL